MSIRLNHKKGKAQITNKRIRYRLAHDKEQSDLKMREAYPHCPSRRPEGTSPARYEWTKAQTQANT